MVPRLTGHKLFTPLLARVQAWTWFFGMLLFSNAYHTLGLLFSVPRRTALGSAPYYDSQWNPQMIESVLGIALLTVSATLFFAIMLFTLVVPRKLDKPVDMPVAQPLNPKPAPQWLDTWWPWLNGAIALVLLSYGPMLYQLIRDAKFWSQGIRVW
jgi:cytochrome c oxidase subunit 1